MVQPPNLRLHLEQRDGIFRTVAQVAFGADASLYLIPYAAGGEYWYGHQRLAAGEASFTIEFKDHVAATARPKLSIHSSGDVHIYANNSPKAGPVRAIPLTEARGEHVATVQIDHVKRMPVHTRPPKAAGEKVDVTFGLPDDVEAARLLVYANGERNLFLAEQIHFAQPVTRDDSSSIWFGFLAVANDPLGSHDEGGVSVLAGFDARKGDDEAQDLLFLRGV